MSIDIQIWSDIACPWCFIGKRRFEQALAAFPQRDQVKVTWRSYQLDPTLPEHDHRSEVDYLVEAKGMPRENVEQMISHVREQAAGVGLAYDFDALKVANSRRAHRLLQYVKHLDAADESGKSRLADQLKDALLSAHFEGGKDIGDSATLVVLGAQVGVSEPEVLEAIKSEELDAAIDADIALGAQIGVRGVPFFVVDNKYGVSGAQPPEVFTQVLNTALADRNPLLMSSAESGESCGIDGCN